MDEEFLVQFRRRPEPQRMDELYRRLSLPAGQNRLAQTLPRSVLAASGVAALLLLILLVSPAARSVLADFIREIGGITFRAPTLLPPPSGQGTTVPFENLTLSEAQARLPFAWAIPVWAPEGYVLEDRVAVFDFSAPVPADEPPVYAAQLAWRKASAESSTVIGLDVHFPAPAEFLVPPDSIEEVTIKDRSAALYRGVYDQQGDLLEPAMLTLTWKASGGVGYSLWTVDGTITPVELIRMAESMP